jgi:hypothetical protein
MSLSWTRCIHSTPSQPTSPRSSVILYSHLCLDLLSGVYLPVYTCRRNVNMDLDISNKDKVCTIYEETNKKVWNPKLEHKQDQKIQTVQEKLMKLRLQWYGHVLPMGDSRIALRTSEMKVTHNSWGDHGLGWETKWGENIQNLVGRVDTDMRGQALLQVHRQCCKCQWIVMCYWDQMKDTILHLTLFLSATWI